MGIGWTFDTGIVFSSSFLRAPISGLNMASVATMSFVEMGQFGSWLFAAIFMNFCVFGCLIASCIFQANIVLE